MNRGCLGLTTARWAFDLFIATYEAKYERATDCLRKDRESLLTFYDFPAEHWRHIRTTNAIENLISSVRRVSRRVKHWQDGTMILRWTAAGLQEAEKGFRRVRGYKDLDTLEDVLRNNDRRIDGESEDVQAA